jgi:putative phosphoesterase
VLLGVISDTHNNLTNLKRALGILFSAGVSTLVHCGDMTDPSMAELLAGYRVIHATGNGDVDFIKIRQTLLNLNLESFSGPLFTGEIGGSRIAVLHGDIYLEAEELARSGKYDYVFHGHSHRRRDEWISTTRVINPGSLGGLLVVGRSICLVELDTGNARFVEII